MHQPLFEVKQGTSSITHTVHVNITYRIFVRRYMQWGGKGGWELTAVLWEEPSEGEGEGGGGGAGNHGGRRTHAAGHHRGGRHMTRLQVSARAGWFICGRDEVGKEEGAGGGAKGEGVREKKGQKGKGKKQD